MKKITTIILLILTFTASAQKCKYAKDEVDEFTNKKILETKSEVLTISGMGFGFSSAYSLMKIDDQRYIRFHFTSPSIMSTNIKDEIMLKMENDEVVRLYFSESQISDGKYQPSIKATIHTMKSMVPINDELYNELQNVKIKKVRFNFSDGYRDDDVSEKRAGKLIEGLKCIL